jgi:6-phosphogluconate dehydrogenase
MRIGMIGLGRMGANMTERLLTHGHECVVYDRNDDKVDALAAKGAAGARTPAELVGQLSAPRVVWMMVPVPAVGSVVRELEPLLDAGDVLVDGGNSFFRDAPARTRKLGEAGIHYLDVGVSGGVFGLREGYCLMIGGDRRAAQRLAPVFAALAPGEPEKGADTDSLMQPARGYLYCGDSGAGHLVKMVHNGIEYGAMAAYAEGFNLLGNASLPAAPSATDEAGDEALHYELDTAAIAELWRHGSVIRSWLLDLTAEALAEDPALSDLRGQVGDSGEGRWMVQTAVDAAVPVPVISAALWSRFVSRERDDYANRILSAMRRAFGGHREGAEP